jgi:hypothetical protein
LRVRRTFCAASGWSDNATALASKSEV